MGESKKFLNDAQQLEGAMRNWLLAALAFLLVASPAAALRAADLAGPQIFLVLRVQANNQSSTTFNADQVKKQFDSVATLWNQRSSYGHLDLQFQFSDLYTLQQGAFTDYIDQDDEASPNAFAKTVHDAVLDAPPGLDWTHLSGIVVYLADTRACGFVRGQTYPGFPVHAPGVGDIAVPVTLITENPIYTTGPPCPNPNPKAQLEVAWGRIAHEIGHALQQDIGPAHPSDYDSDFEEMDREYPAQTGVFEKQSNRAFPGWLAPEKYFEVHPSPTPATVTIRAAEQDPAGSTDAQAVRAYLGVGGDSFYYLISVRRRELGDDVRVRQPSPPPPPPTDCDMTATPNGIPDCGVLIERVVEGGDPTLKDCDPQSGVCIDRWVDVLGNAGEEDKLWHDGDVFSSASYSSPNNAANVKADGITISVHKGSDSDHYRVVISYNGAPRPDVGLSDWLRPPSNDFETTDIWVDSPVNGYASPDDTDANAYRYGVWPDLKGGTVPKGNGDDPAIGQVNRIYARVRNFGTVTANNVTVRFDVTDPPGLGISGAQGFKEIGSATVDAIPPGGFRDVFVNWTPDVPLTADQLSAGQFYFHTCLRVRIDPVPGETFLANQDGAGEQENVGYFDVVPPGAGPPSAGAPASNEAVVHLRNDNATSPKTFALGLLRGDLPRTWQVDVNKGVPVLTLAPGEVRDIPIVLTQAATEPIGSRHRLRVIASSQVTLSHATPATLATPGSDDALHTEIHPLGGVTFEVAVVRPTVLDCSRSGGGRVDGRLTGFDPSDREVRVHLVGVKIDHNKLVTLTPTSAWAKVDLHTGLFTFPSVTPGLQVVCLYAGSSTSASAASRVFTN